MNEVRHRTKPQDVYETELYLWSKFIDYYFAIK